MPPKKALRALSSSINKKEKQEKGGPKLERENVFIKYKC